jgi:hypothetical protein
MLDEWKISDVELKRRERVLKDAVASCAIEGLHLAPEDLEEVHRIAMSYETSNEMVAELKKRMGID